MKPIPILIFILFLVAYALSLEIGYYKSKYEQAQTRLDEATAFISLKNAGFLRRN
jgi:hypothetical protein